jgi:AcrR family transcriptional regulator
MTPERRAANARKPHARILRAATRLFADHGYDAVGLREIAAAADTSLSVVVTRFKTKEALYLTVLHQLTSDLEGEVRSTVFRVHELQAAGLGSVHRAEAALDAVETWLVADPRRARLLLRALLGGGAAPEADDGDLPGELFRSLAEVHPAERDQPGLVRRKVEQHLLTLAAGKALARLWSPPP